MTDDRLNDPPKVQWEGKYIRVVTRGGWEYVERCGGVGAVVILAETDGKVILIEQSRVPLGGRMSLELPAGLVGDEAITSVTTPETWGEAMASLLTHVRNGQVADGMVAAIEQIGVVLAVHFPRAADDKNEIPDKLIEL